MNRYIVLLSGGVGLRFGLKYPKQYHKNYKGNYYFIESLKCFIPHIKLFKQIIIVCHEAYEQLFISELTHLDMQIKFARPGTTRQGSINNAIDLLKKNINMTEDNQVFIQEAVRPFTRSQSIHNMIEVEKKYKAVSLSLKSPVLYSIYDKEKAEGIKLINKDNIIELQLPKRYDLNFWINHTVNCSYDINAIDESQLFLDNNISIKCIKGSSTNIKITFPEQLNIGETILEIIGEKNKNVVNEYKKEE